MKWRVVGMDTVDPLKLVHLRTALLPGDMQEAASIYRDPKRRPDIHMYINHWKEGPADYRLWSGIPVRECWRGLQDREGKKTFVPGTPISKVLDACLKGFGLTHKDVQACWERLNYGEKPS